MIALCRGYDHSSFRDDLRQLYWQAGVLRHKTVFFFADYQIAQEEFMEDIDSILNSGESTLFAAPSRKLIQGPHGHQLEM